MSKLELTDKNGRVYLVEERCAEEVTWKDWAFKRTGATRIEINYEGCQGSLALEVKARNVYLNKHEFVELSNACLRAAEYLGRTF